MRGRLSLKDAGRLRFAWGSRVMFTAPYGGDENGTWQIGLLVRTPNPALVRT